MEDGRIVELYLKKEEQALKESAMKYGRKLRGIAYGILRNSSDAEECENDTYLSAWNSIPPHEPRNYLFTFLGRITREFGCICRRRIFRRNSDCGSRSNMGRNPWCNWW